MRSRSKRIVATLFVLSLIASAINPGRPVSAAPPSAEAPSPAPASSQSARAPRSLRGAEAAKFLRESGISDSLDGAAAGGYVEQGRLLAADGAAQDSLGFSVAVSGDTAVVGAPADGTGSNTRHGSAYVYVRTGSTWAQQQKLNASDLTANDEFGYAVATSGDTIFVGRHFTQVGNPARTRGAVYVFTRSGATWTQSPTQLTASDAADGDLFGASLAYDNGTLLVGALQKNSGATFFRGAAYVFTGAGAAWNEQAKLLADDGGFADFFGFSVAVSGDTAVVGATGLNGGGAASGRGWAYVFTRSGSAWTQQQKLQASDGAAGDAFGFSVGVSGAAAVVGARADVVGASGEVGSAYVFTRSGAVWAEQQKLTAQEATPRNDFFGNGVAIKNDTIIVGSPAHEIVGNIANHGAVYVFTRSGAAWTRQQKLIHSDPAPDALGQAVAFDGSSILAGAPAKTSARGAAYVFAFTQNGSVRITADDGTANDEFGHGVAISGDTLVVGAHLEDDAAGPNRGAAYVYVRSGSTWAQQAKLAPSDAGLIRFGTSVAIAGDTVVVGAEGSQIGQNGTQGSAYVFTRTGSAWAQQARLLADDGATGDSFGNSVSVSGDTVVVGAVLKDVGGNFNQGAAYVYTRSGSAWTQQAKLTASDGAANDNFGSGVSVSGDTVVCGAFGDAPTFGSAYVFTRSGAAWSQQQKLTPADGNGSQINYGISVALSGDTALVGAEQAGGNTSGAAYVYTRAGSTWAQQQVLVSADAQLSERFGFSVALEGDTAVVGAYQKRIGDTGFNQGSAHAFRRSGAAWSQVSKLTAFDGVAGDQFGRAVAVSGTTAAVGVPLDDFEGKVDQGSAHVFTVESGGGGGAQTTVQFAAAAASVAEGFTPPSPAGGGDVVAANSVTVSVTRAGDTTGTTFVRYAPAAADGSGGCAPATGTALPRCDYTGATGTLRFDPGQAEKQVRVFVTDDSFSEGAETFALVLSAPQGATLGAQSSVTVTVGDNDPVPNAPNPIDDHGFFVHTQYTDFLGRPPEPSGYQAWLAVLNDCPNPTNSPACDRVTVASSFFRSQEYEIKGFFVFRFYKAALGRRPSYEEFAADLSRVSGDTAEQVNAARAAFPAEFAARDEFRARYDALSDAAYVDALVQTAGVDLGARRQQLKDQLAAGALTRAGVLREVVETQEVIARNYNEGFVSALYFGFLGRDPEPGGFENWLAYMNAHPDDFRTMVTGFVNSVEYRLRFGKSD